MMTKRMSTVLMALAVVGVMVCPNLRALAEDKPAPVDELKKGQEELKAELAVLKAELAAMRNELRQVLTEVTNMRKAPPPQQPQKPPQPPADTTVYDIPVGSSPVTGPKDAKATIVWFADLQCPFCIKEYPKIQQVLKDYPSDVKFVFKHFPLGFHKQAKPAAAAMALAAQKSNETSWKMVDLIVANPKALEVADLRKHAESLGMDLADFDKVMADEKQVDALIAADMEQAAKINVRGTPTILINGLKMNSRNPEDYKNRIDEILKGPKAEGGDKEKGEKKEPQIIKLEPATGGGGK